jgi:hypothetical protein
MTTAKPVGARDLNDCTIYFTSVLLPTTDVQVQYREIPGGLTVNLPYSRAAITTPNTVPTPQA